MDYQKLNKRCNRFIWVACLMLFFIGLMGVAGGGVLNDLDKALVEIEELERRGLLQNPPETTSDYARFELGLLHNSAGVEEYIKETGQRLTYYGYAFCTISFLFISSIILKLFVWVKLRRLRKLLAQES